MEFKQLMDKARLRILELLLSQLKTFHTNISTLWSSFFKAETQIIIIIIIFEDASDFIGCFSHSSGNYSNNKKTQNNLMHVQLCIDFCYKSKFSLAALSGIG